MSPRILFVLLIGLMPGCAFMPQIAHQPQLHNPFPQLTVVAVAPFFNLSTDASVDGRQFAEAYYAELQEIPGFEVIPVGVVENVIYEHQLSLSGPADVRRLAQLLQADAVVVGAINDYSPYYPPRCGMRVEWFAANPGFHFIPPGYGLPWGTCEEEQIPAPLVFEAEHALARAQLATQSPHYQPEPAESQGTDEQPREPMEPDELEPEGMFDDDVREIDPVSHEELVYDESHHDPSTPLPPDWPDPRGFIPAPPSAQRPACTPHAGPVMSHTALYSGNDQQFTEALDAYYQFRDDARSGGWQTYLQRSSDFIRFCCHTHLSEMLSARGGAGETRVVWRWSYNR